MRVLGVDPSSQATGYGVLELKDGRYAVLGYGTIKPRRAAELPAKLLEIKTGIERLIGAFEPGDVAVENPFFGLNIRTAITLGQVRGAVLVAVWYKLNRKNSDQYYVPIASGLIAGESLIAALIAIACTVVGLLAVR